MWELSLSWWELALRGAVVYLAVYALIRVVGKRQVGELTPFDLTLLLLISEAVSNALRADDNSLTGGAIVVVTMLGINWMRGQAWRALQAFRSDCRRPAAIPRPRREGRL